MGELIKKELKSFFTSLSGYIILAFFLIANGLFLWVVPGVYNIFDSGMADLQPFFALSPVLYLFLVPVLCMRLFAEERRSGTLELLFTRPVSIGRIVLAKYIAGLALVLLSILPTIVYPLCLWFLSLPAGHIDTGGIIGSYTGLFFLSAIYVSACVWASSVTDNQIVAFLYGLVLSFLLYSGFDFLASLPWLSDFENELLYFGFNYHYEPMSRGVIALSDVVYFISVVLFFLWLTARRFHGVRVGWLYVLPLLVVVNVAAARAYVRADITNDKRYTLSDNTIRLLKGMDRRVEIDIFLAGNLPPGIQKLQYATTRMLEEFCRISGNNFRYNIVDPSEIREQEEKKALVRYLAERGIVPVNLNRRSEDETVSQQYIFPGLVMYDDSTEVSVNLLQNVPGRSGEDNINHSMEALEYELTKAARLITRKEKKSVAFMTGHGELPYTEVMDMAKTLLYYYHVDFVSADSLADDLTRYEALVVAKPTQDFTERDKYIIDQYVMNGGSVLWCLDEVDVDGDLLKTQESAMAVFRPLHVEDLLFRYGVRINPELILDGNCALIPVMSGAGGQRPEFRPAKWYYSPLLLPGENHPVTNGIAPVRVDYANSIDTVGGNDGLKKTILLTSSQYTAAVKTPCMVSLSITGEKMEADQFNQRYKPVAVMVEGKFRSPFLYRKMEGVIRQPFRPESEYNRMIIIADGDIIRNKTRGVGENATAVPLGYDEYSGQMYGNRDFLLNCVNTLCDDEGWMGLRGRSLSFYPLDKTRLKTERRHWEMINLSVPLIVVMCGGFVFAVIRRRKYRKSKN